MTHSVHNPLLPLAFIQISVPTETTLNTTHIFPVFLSRPIQSIVSVSVEPSTEIETESIPVQPIYFLVPTLLHLLEVGLPTNVEPHLLLNVDGGDGSNTELTLTTRHPNGLVHSCLSLAPNIFCNFLFGRGSDEIAVICDRLEPIKLRDLELDLHAKRSLEVENAGGKSVLSEMLSIQYFQTVYGATNVLLEMEVEYWCEYRMVDFVCEVGGRRVGVSVTRAMQWNPNIPFTLESARYLLNKKLYGLVVARNAVIKGQRFFNSVLHCFCMTERIAELMREAYDELEGTMGVRGVMMMILTVYENHEIYALDCYKPIPRVNSS